MNEDFESVNRVQLVGRVEAIRVAQWPDGNRSIAIRLKTWRIKATDRGPLRSAQFHEVIFPGVVRVETFLKKVGRYAVLYVEGSIRYGQTKSGRHVTDIYSTYYVLLKEGEPYDPSVHVKTETVAQPNAFVSFDHKHQDSESAET